MWSRYFYPPQVYANKTKPNALGEYIIQEVSGSSQYLLLIPGIGVKEFDPEFILKTDVFNLEKFKKNADIEKWNIEAIPPLCYQYRYTPFSLEKWAESIQQRVATIQATNPSAIIYCYGVSMGGAATALASKSSDNPEKEAYVIIDTFSSLSMLIWHESWISILSFFIHFIPITLLVLLIGAEVSNITYIAGLSAFITTISTLAISTLYIKIEHFFINLHSYDFSREPTFISRQHYAIRTLFQYICQLVGTILWLIYTPTHYIAHGFICFQLWLLDSLSVISNKKLGKNCIVTQNIADRVIPTAARLLTSLKGQNANCIQIAIDNNTAHGVIPHTEIYAKSEIST